jgi:hypothetical protein
MHVILYDDNDKETKFCKNEDCKEARFTSDRAPVRKMKMFSLAKIVSLWLANDKIRSLMQYRYKYKFSSKGYTGFLDGNAHKTLLDIGCLKSRHDIAL